MNLKITDTVSNPGYVWMFAVQFLVSVQTSAVKPVLQNFQGVLVGEGSYLGVTQNWNCCHCERLVSYSRVSAMDDCDNMLLCWWRVQVQCWVLQTLPARAENVQSVWSRRRAEILTEGPVTWVLTGGLRISPAEEQLNFPVSDPCCVLEINNLQVALKDKKAYPLYKVKSSSAILLVAFSKSNSTAKLLENGTIKCSDFIDIAHNSHVSTQ